MNTAKAIDGRKGSEVLRVWFQRVWTDGDASAIAEMFPDHGEAAGLGAQAVVGPEAFRQFHAAFIQLVTDIEITVDQGLDSPPWTSVLCTLRGKSIREGQPVSMTGTAFARVEDGKIMAAYNHWDFMGLWGQLGFLPTDCFEQGLAGRRVV